MAFSSVTPAKLGRGAVGSTVSTFYTVPVLTRTFVKDIDIANTTTSTINATVYLVESGGTAGTSNALLYSVMVPANGTLQWTGSQIIHAGDTIQALGSTTGLTINISGGEAV